MIFKNCLTTRIDAAALPIRRTSRTYKGKGYWLDIENRQSFLREVAAEVGIDPLHGEAWQQVSRAMLSNKQV